MTDPAQRAVERIANLWAKDQIVCNQADVDRMVSIIRGEYIALHAIQARAEHLESVLAKVREAHKRYDESGLIGGPGDCYLYDWLTDILNESDTEENS